ncbi:MAG: ATPase [Oscillospiraceae bacterium]|nr:ATPase [Oscillospiraceae bacterium]
MSGISGNTENLLDNLSELLQKAFSLPFGADRCIVDRDKVLGLIDEVRNVMPPEIEQACQIVQSRNDIINDAKREAAAIKRQAEERALQIVNESKIVQEAKSKAREIESKARLHEREVRGAANDYVEDTLKKLGEFVAQLGGGLNTINGELQKVRGEFKSAARAVEQR